MLQLITRDTIGFEGLLRIDDLACLLAIEIVVGHASAWMLRIGKSRICPITP
ncbi:hypothetical protein [Methylobacterium sp. J-090]|uniref:hypothetical protein n=1 Tax=Methylobacterium sp. J-090 TaxID=2836666 RepID=UPI001FBA0AF5|nr:hypothetical protein [Methylobacterium sp. J-090]MCJ2083959.1 hypothetical protein [Methylobacterium sp. J-090]